jgi:hypothetical protein
MKRPVTLSSAPGPRVSTPVVQRLALPQAGRDIAEDNQTLKEEYFRARDDKRWTDWAIIMALQTAQAKAWKEQNDREIEAAVLKALGPLEEAAPVVSARVEAPVAPGVVKAAILLSPPFKGTTAGQRYIRWGKSDYPHTSITFKLEQKGEVARITGLHASMGQSDTHLWWNHQSPPGTFHLSNQGGAKYEQADVDGFSSSGRELLQRAWLKVEKHAKKVNCTAAKPPGIE